MNEFFDFMKIIIFIPENSFLGVISCGDYSFLTKRFFGVMQFLKLSEKYVWKKFLCTQDIFDLVLYVRNFYNPEKEVENEDCDTRKNQSTKKIWAFFTFLLRNKVFRQISV